MAERVHLEYYVERYDDGRVRVDYTDDANFLCFLDEYDNTPEARAGIAEHIAERTYAFEGEDTWADGKCGPCLEPEHDQCPLLNGCSCCLNTKAQAHA